MIPVLAEPFYRVSTVTLSPAHAYKASSLIVHYSSEEIMNVAIDAERRTLVIIFPKAMTRQCATCDVVAETR